MGQKYMAQWGHKGFLVDPTKIVPFNDLATAFTLKSEYHTDTTGKEPVYVRGRELQSITLSTTYLSVLNVDPRNQMRQWYDCIGMTYPLYINGIQFGPPLLQLVQVDWSNFLFLQNGKIIGVDAAIMFNEYIGPEKLISQETFNSWTGNTSPASTGPSKSEKQLMANGITVTYPYVEVQD